MYDKFAKYFANAIVADQKVESLLKDLDFFQAIPMIKDRVGVEFKTSAFSFKIARNPHKIEDLSCKMGTEEKQVANLKELEECFLGKVRDLFKSHKDIWPHLPSSIKEVFHLSGISGLNPEIVVTIYSLLKTPQVVLDLSDENLTVTHYLLSPDWKQSFVIANSLLEVAGVPHASSKKLWEPVVTIKDLIEWLLSFASEISFDWDGRPGSVSVFPVCDSKLKECAIRTDKKVLSSVVDHILSAFKLQTESLSELLKQPGFHIEFWMPFFITGEIHQDKAVITF